LQDENYEKRKINLLIIINLPRNMKGSFSPRTSFYSRWCERFISRM